MKKKSGLLGRLDVKAFTLIELLVVVLIIGILAAIALPQYQVAVGKARFMELITAANAIQKAEEVYYLANGVYTSSMDDLSVNLPPDSKRVTNLNGPSSYLIVSYRGFDPYFVAFFEQHSGAIWRGRRECRVSNNQLNAVNRQICASVTGSTEGTGDIYSLWVFKK